MVTKSIRIVAVAALLLLPTLSGSFAAEVATPAREMVAGNTAFALDLYSALKSEKGNLFFSPYSISSVMALLYGGARGDTAGEIAKTLHFDLGPQNTHPAFGNLNSRFQEIQQKGGVQLRTANSLWPRKEHPVLSDYLALSKRDYGAAILPVRYGGPEAPLRINHWVQQKTEGKIDRIVPPNLDASTVMVVVNAIYFKGKWEEQLDPKQSRQAPFMLLNKAKKDVTMMNRMGRYRYQEVAGAKLLEMPYVGKDLSMIVILPAEAGQLPAIESQLTAKNLSSWTSNMPLSMVDLFLPKFKMMWGAQDLRLPLEGLGMRLPFTGRADLSGIDGRRDLYISALYHKAYVDVNEEGTEAAAATAGVVRMTALRPPRILTFRADHPFIFLIRDNQTGSILFMGRVVEPA